MSFYLLSTSIVDGDNTWFDLFCGSTLISTVVDLPATIKVCPNLTHYLDATAPKQNPEDRPYPRDLRSGDHMTREQFHQVYSMMPESFRAEGLSTWRLHSSASMASITRVVV